MKILNKIEVALIALCLITMTGITFANVISRYILLKSWSFTEELTTYLFVWVTFLGASVATQRRGHLGLTIITDHLPKKAKLVVALFAVLVGVVLFALLLKYGVDMTLNQKKLGQITPALGLPEWLFGLSIPVGAALMLVRFVELGVKEIRGVE